MQIYLEIHASGDNVPSGHTLGPSPGGNTPVPLCGFRGPLVFMDDDWRVDRMVQSVRHYTASRAVSAEGVLRNLHSC